MCHLSVILVPSSTEPPDLPPWALLPRPLLTPLWDSQPVPRAHALIFIFSFCLATFSCIIVGFGGVYILFIIFPSIKLCHSEISWVMGCGGLTVPAITLGESSTPFLLRSHFPKLLPVVTRFLVLSKMSMETFDSCQKVLKIWSWPKHWRFKKKFLGSNK